MSRICRAASNPFISGMVKSSRTMSGFIFFDVFNPSTLSSLRSKPPRPVAPRSDASVRCGPPRDRPLPAPAMTSALRSFRPRYCSSDFLARLPPGRLRSPRTLRRHAPDLKVPAKLRCRSRIPAVPTPSCTFPPAGPESKGIPLPWSSISTRTSASLRTARIITSSLHECLCMFVNASCTIRKIAISGSRGSPPNLIHL